MKNSMTKFKNVAILLVIAAVVLFSCIALNMQVNFQQGIKKSHEDLSNAKNYEIETKDRTVVYRLVPQTDTGMRRVYYRVEGDKVKLAENDYELWGDASDWAGNDESEETGRNESGEN